MLVEVCGLPVKIKGGGIRYALVDPYVFAYLNDYRWRANSRGYVYRYLAVDERGEVTSEKFLHRIILGLEKGDRREGDHINGDPLDNRRENLRILTHAENCQNHGGQLRRKSKYRNVYPTRGGRWRVSIKVGDVQHQIGGFATEYAAAAAAKDLRARVAPLARRDEAAA
jgi:hypothetical protein